MALNAWHMVGYVKAGYPERDVKVYVEIGWDGKRLSISGVEGPKANGDCLGGAGQIRLDHVVPLDSGVDTGKLQGVWDRWHLNDMRPGCEHQRLIDTTRKVEIVTYKLTRDAIVEQADLKRDTWALLMRQGRVELSDDARALLELPYTRTSAPDADSTASGRYEVDKRESKAIGWVTQAEHPEGMLSKPCEVCGYKYGSRWLSESVPEDVIAFLASLPACDAPKGWSR